MSRSDSTMTTRRVGIEPSTHPSGRVHLPQGMSPSGIIAPALDTAKELEHGVPFLTGMRANPQEVTLGVDQHERRVQQCPCEG